MKNHITIISAAIISVAILVGMGALAYSNYRIAQNLVAVRKVVQAPAKDCPTPQNTFDETVYLIDNKTTSRLPFCALVSDWSKDVVCYDWAHWGDTDGVSIFNVKSK